MILQSIYGGWFKLWIFSGSWLIKLHFNTEPITVSCQVEDIASVSLFIRRASKKKHMQYILFLEYLNENSLT